MEIKQVKDELENKIKELDKFKLMDIISTYAYFYGSLDKNKYALCTVELELLMECIYKTESYGTKKPSVEDIEQIIDMIKELLDADEKKNPTEETPYYNYAVNDFLYVKEDKKHVEILDEYEKLFGKFDPYFLNKYQFTIHDFIWAIELILQEYNARINYIERSIKKERKEDIIQPKQLLEYLTNSYNLVMNFNCSSFSKRLEDMIVMQHFLDKFSYNMEGGRRF